MALRLVGALESCRERAVERTKTPRAVSIICGGEANFRQNRTGGTSGIIRQTVRLILAEIYVYGMEGFGSHRPFVPGNIGSTREAEIEDASDIRGNFKNHEIARARTGDLLNLIFKRDRGTVRHDDSIVLRIRLLGSAERAFTGKTGFSANDEPGIRTGNGRSGF